MELFNKIKELRAQAFKSGDKFLHSVLTNVFSDANPVGTDSGQTPADESVTAVVKKHLKGVVESIEAMVKTNVEADVLALKNREKEILESLLPKQLTEDQLHDIFNNLLPSTVKDFMSHLKSFYAGLFDGKLAKKVFDTAIQAQVGASGVNEALKAETPIGDTLSAPIQGVVAEQTTPTAQTDSK